MSQALIPVVLSGGGGTRLWPLSRTRFPKQFLPLNGENTMLQETLQRLTGIDNLQQPLVICNEEHRFLVAEQLRVINEKASAIILEPVGRNTAPAVALAAIKATEDSNDALLLVLPADHVINDSEGFQNAVAAGREQASNGKLVTFGIKATAPETGYGYIKRGQKLDNYGDLTAYQVDQFVEKPNEEVATRYIESGCYDWNSGIFLFSAKTFLSELEKFQPKVLETCKKAYNNKSADFDFLRVETAAFEASPDIAIDYAVMEKTEHAVVVPMSVGWNDLGSWSAMWENGEKDPQGNAVTGDTMLEDCNNCYVHADSKLVTAIGLENTVIVQTCDAILVADKSKVQEVKTIVSRLKETDRSEAYLHPKVHRPWGTYESVDNGERYQVKRITVKPGSTLSLQMHHHRAEHWIVVSGTAKVTRNDDTLLLSENESVFIPLGAKHRLENPGTIDLHMIEVQSGSYLGEDDIVRFEDNYGRS